ncbi:helix-turn-helix domain-containing protein [Streptomyces prunicolor]|uniref:helix-turn-helix domain-containing protein n=1 Tax=Streptomyces prunicolor TaxID=67348 RepID=UPI0037CF4036
MAEAHSEARRIGEAIRQARVLQRRSQKDVAAALGYHQSKVSRLESGHGTEDIRVLRAVAQELGIAPHQLGLAAFPDASAADSETEDMHRRTFLAASIAALATPAASAAAHNDLVQALLPGLSPASTGAVMDTTVLRERVGAARRLFYTCDYTELERILPSLIADLRLASTGTLDSDVLSALLATAYQTSTSLLLKQHDQAVTLVRHTADQLTGSYDRRSPKYLAAVGLLLLRGVTAASGGGDRAATEEFLAEAKEVARYVSLDRPDAWANFSPTNVALHELSALVAFGDAGLAVQAARPLMRRHIPVPERRAALWVETARAYSQQGRLSDGYQALRIAETCAAQDVRRPAVRDLVADMAARDRRRTLPELHHFSRQLGVPA